MSRLYEGHIIWQIIGHLFLVLMSFLCFRVLNKFMFPSSTKIRKTENSTAILPRMCKRYIRHSGTEHTNRIMDHALAGANHWPRRIRLVLWNENVFVAKIIKSFQWMTFNEALLRAKNFGSGLISLGLSPGAKTFVCIYSQNRPEWILCEQGCYDYSLVLVPLYGLNPTFSKKANLKVYFHRHPWPRCLCVYRESDRGPTCRCWRWQEGQFTTGQSSEAIEKIGCN